MAQVRCPVCGKRFDATESTSLPFCGARCRQIDLGRWLGETYAVPVETREEDDEELSPD